MPKKKTPKRDPLQLIADKFTAETPTGQAAIEMARVILVEGSVESRREARQWIRVALAADQQHRDAQVAELVRRFLARDRRAHALDAFDASFQAGQTQTTKD